MENRYMKTSYGIIWQILNVLDLSLDYDEVPENVLTAKKLGITQNRFEAYLKMLEDAGYIEGVEFEDFISEKEPVLNREKIRITLEGIEFLIENSAMSKIAAAAKEVGLVVAEAGVDLLAAKLGK
jgi:DNA-binding transcriptional ArsR family regulator